MTWREFENLFCNLLSKQGYWALNIPKNQSGAQPFDVIAIKGIGIIAVDCKVCGSNRFPLNRIEDNQWAAFELMRERTTDADIGIVAYYNGDIYFLSYEYLKDCLEWNEKSIKLTEKDIIARADEIENVMRE